MTWDPATTGGTATADAIPLLPMLLWAVPFALAILAFRLWRRRPFARPAGWPEVLAWALMLLGPLGVMGWLQGWEPLSGADPVAPGSTVAEVRADGTYEGDAWVEGRVTSWGSDDPGPCMVECPAPRYIYRVRPGEWYWWLETVRNEGPFEVRILGLAGDPSVHGLALPRDPGGLAGDPASLRPFQPVTVPPGGTVTLAVAELADACADPAAPAATDQYSSGNTFVYEALGYRGESTAWHHVSIRVTGCESGMPDIDSVFSSFDLTPFDPFQP